MALQSEICNVPASQPGVRVQWDPISPGESALGIPARYRSVPLGRWRKLSESVVFRNPWWTYRLDRFETPAGVRGEYHYVHTRGSSMVVPVTRDGSLLLVDQFRFLMDRTSLEFPAGGVKEGSSHEETARAELAEETGQGADEWEPVGQFNPCNGVVDEMCNVYIARGLRAIEGAAPDETEELEVRSVTVAELEAAIGRGEIWDGMTLAAWQMARHRLAR